MIAIENKQNKLIDKITELSFNAGMNFGMNQICNNILKVINDTKHLNPAKQIQYVIYYINSTRQKLNDKYSNEDKDENINAEENT